MLETIVAGLITHLGKKVIDKFWGELQNGKNPVVDITGNMDTTTSHAGRTLVKKAFTIPSYQEEELIIGNFYLDFILEIMVLGDEVPLVLIVEETHDQVFLFEADLETGYEIYLPHGTYSFYVFLVEKDEKELLNAEIYAVGFPSRIDLSLADTSQQEDIDAWELADDTPIEVTHGGPFMLDFVLIDVDELPDFPKYFSELVE